MFSFPKTFTHHAHPIFHAIANFNNHDLQALIPTISIKLEKVGSDEIHVNRKLQSLNLFDACILHNNIDALKIICQQGDFKCTLNSYRICLEKGHVTMFDFLLKQYPIDNQFFFDDIMFLTLFHGQLDCLKQLVQYGKFSLDSLNSNHSLRTIVESGNLEVFEYLLNNQLIDIHNKTFLIDIVTRDHNPINTTLLQMLLKYMDPTLPDNNVDRAIMNCIIPIKNINNENDIKQAIELNTSPKLTMLYKFYETQAKNNTKLAKSSETQSDTLKINHTI